MISLRMWSASPPERLDASLPAFATESARARDVHWTRGRPIDAMHNSGKLVIYEQAIAYSVGENRHSHSDFWQMSLSSNIPLIGGTLARLNPQTATGAREKAPRLEPNSMSSVIARA
jgi:hypothetical protein